MAEWNQAIDVHYFAELLQQWGHLDKAHDATGWGVRTPAFQEALAKWQEHFRYMLDDGTQRWHGRALIADGLLGPASLELLNTPRCGCSDTQAVEEANWPDSCRQDITVWWDLAGLNVSKERSDSEMRDAYKSWYDRVNLKFREVETSDARIHSHTAALSGSTLADSYLATNSCSSRLRQRYNTRTNWNRSDRKYLQAVGAHEIGHALGCPHINNTSALMNPYITSITVPQRLDLELMQRLGYQLRTTPPEPPDPPTPPTPQPPSVDIKQCILVFTDGTQRKWSMIEKVT